MVSMCIMKEYAGASDTESDGVYGRVYIQGDNVRVQNCDFYAAYDEENSAGIGWQFGMVWGTVDTQNVVFDNCTFQTNTMAIFPMADTGEINDCTFKALEDENYPTKSMALNSTQMQDVKITGNTFYGVRMMVGGNLTVTGNQF